MLFCAITTTDFTALAALVVGLASLAVSYGNYLRDKARVAVRLQWDMTIYPTNQDVGIVTVTNVGRRPIFISHAALELNKTRQFLLLAESVPGIKLAEGDQPKQFIVEYDKNLKKWANDWDQIVVQITDSTGKIWRSNRKEIKKRPSWA